MRQIDHSTSQQREKEVFGTGQLFHLTKEEIKETSVWCWSQDWKEKSVHALKMGGMVTVLECLQNKLGSFS